MKMKYLYLESLVLLLPAFALALIVVALSLPKKTACALHRVSTAIAKKGIHVWQVKQTLALVMEIKISLEKQEA